MSVKANECYLYGSASMPDVDGATTGGAVAFSKKLNFAQLASTGTVDYVSSSTSDTAATITVTGRDGTGVVQTETKTFTGTTPVTGSQSFERLMKAVAGGTTAVGDLAVIAHTAAISAHTMQAGSANGTGTTPPVAKLQSGDGSSATVNRIIRITSGTGSGQIRQVVDNTSYGTDIVAVNRDWSTVPDATSVYSVYDGMLLDISPNQITECREPFFAVQADVAGGSSRTFYEKAFYVNNNTATALTGAAIKKTVDPSAGTFELALCTALNDTGTVANRQTAPSSGIGSFTTGSAPQSVTVPGSGNLPSGAAPNSAGAQGVWMSLALPAGTAPGKTSATLQATGSTT